MSLPILTAVTDRTVEAELVSAFHRGDLGVTIVRRCVDLPDLLAAASAGTARAALVSGDLRRLDREALARLGTGGVAVVGLVGPDDEDAERRLRQLGVGSVVTSLSTAQEVAAAVTGAVDARPDAPGFDFADSRAALPMLSPVDPDDPLWPDAAGHGVGRVVAVWGPTGAPGRTTVAVGLAAELAVLGFPTLLVDADSYGGSIAQLLGLLEEAPGLAAAARSANQGTLDVPRLAGLARDLGDGLRLLPGITRPARWTELRPASLEVVLSLARRLTAVTVVDCGFCLEQDEELSYDAAAPRRNGSTLACLAAADTVLAVGSADPVGLQRLVRGLVELSDAVPGVAPEVVVNRLRGTVVPGDPATEVTRALQTHTGLAPRALIPFDPVATDAAQASGRLLREVAPDSPVRTALQGLAAGLSGRPAARHRRRVGRRIPSGSS